MRGPNETACAAHCFTSMGEEATGAIIIRLIDNALGVEYRYPNGAREVRALGPDDRLILDRLRRAGQVEYVDEDVRRRYSAKLK
jgi:hypothetical protein